MVLHSKPILVSNPSIRFTLIMDEKDVTVDPMRNSSLDTFRNDEKSLSAKDLDETYELYKRQDARNIDPQEAKHVLRKIDWHILPLLMGTYMLQYLDKSSINFAAVFGLEDGTHLTGQDYSWYVGGRLSTVAMLIRHQ